MIMNPNLEDVAGNNFRDLLDHQEGVVADVTPTTLSLALARCSNGKVWRVLLLQGYNHYIDNIDTLPLVAYLAYCARSNRRLLNF